VPLLIIVSGQPGSGKSTLAHRLAGALGVPAICRDELRESLDPDIPDPDLHVYHVFFSALDLLLGSGVSVLAEAAYQDKLWRPELEKIDAELRIIRCAADPAVVRRRFVDRAADGPAHHDAKLVAEIDAGRYPRPGWTPISVAAPTLDVDTTDGYRPALAEIISFVRAGPIH